MASFGIVEAAKRARAWARHLETEGQRLVLAGLVMHMNADSMADPTVGQLVDWSGYTDRACRRILTQLEEAEVIAPIGGRSKGRKATQWTIRPGPVSPGSTRTGESGEDPPTRTLGTPTRTLGATNPDPARSSSESSEISESACLHQFEERAVGSREFTACTLCGVRGPLVEEVAS